MTIYEIADPETAKAALAEAKREIADAVLVGRDPQTPLSHPGHCTRFGDRGIRIRNT
ncbi:hypothetical protein [Rhodococcus koreensis]|uniref:hypothetical protein n=1 Tax=Rhodococcus koreensis TaxID=99653 RepID=UPI00367109B6